jgi:signal transduction histidine kinase/CheY-like chemotaxis protein
VRRRSGILDAKAACSELAVTATDCAVLSRLSIKLKVLVAPLAVMLLLIGVSAGSVWLLHSQGNAFKEVVGGSFDAATTTSRLALNVSGIHSDIIRHLNVLTTQQNTDALAELRSTLPARFELAEAMLQSIETNAPSVDPDLLHEVVDFLSIYRIVATRAAQMTTLNPTLVSSLVAHYNQLDAYLNQLAETTIRAAKDKQQRTEEFVGRAVNLLLAGVIITLLLAFIATWLIGRAISAPLQEMTAVMSRLAEGEHEIRVPAMDRKDEVGSMACAVEVFRQASLRLHQREAELAQMVENLAVTRDQAAEASRAKSAFLANMSHELRTPLNAVLGYAQLLQWEEGLSEKLTKGLSTIENSGQHLLTLIDEVLDLAKIEAGRVELHAAPLALEPFLHSIVEIVRVRAEQKGLHFAYEAHDLPDAVAVDEKPLRQVLLNLLGNAAKFTDRGDIAFRVLRMPQETPAALVNLAPRAVVLRFEVRDTGIGMAEQDLQTLFQPFQQVGDLQRRRGGTGLGLAISRELVRLMKSDIHVTSTPGQGSTFWFDLKLPLAQAQADAPNQGVTVGYEGPRKKVLVVDDVPENRSVLVEMLRPLGFETFEALDGREGLERAQELHPDLILMDNIMPVMDGLETTRRLRALPELKDIPVVAISASATKADKDKALAAGCTDFLSKPFRANELFALLERYLHLRFTTR